MKLEIGYNHPFEIRRETCVANCRDEFTILYLSDLHFNRYSQAISERIGAAINALNPDIILLGGDYVDSSKGLVHFNQLLLSIIPRKNIFAIAGNHDHFFGLEKIVKTFSAHGITWLEKKTIELYLNKTLLKIDGNFINKEKTDADISILFLHNPLEINDMKGHYAITCAGHLHGSQVVFWQSDNKLYPGRLFYKWNILKTVSAEMSYFISKGLGDTLPIRFNCKRDMIFIQVKRNS